MPVTLTVDGVAFDFPVRSDEGYGTDVTAWATAITAWVQSLADAGGGGSVTTDGEGIEIAGSELSLELDGATLSKSATGLKVADGGIANTQIDASAAIALSKLATLTGSRALVSTAGGVISVSAVTAVELGRISGLSSNVQTQLDAKPDSGSIVNADIGAGAAIAVSKLAALTADRALQTSASGVIEPSAVTSTELGHLDGVTSAIQTQIDTKITENAGAIVNADVNASAAIALSKLAALTASRALVSDGSGFVSVSAVTAAEVAHLDGVTSAIQTQFGVARQYLISFSKAGALTVGNGAALQVPVPIAGTITAGRAYAGTAPVGAALNLQVANVTDAVDIFTGALAIADGSNLGSSTSIANPTLAVDDILRLDVDQVGSGTAGSDLVVVLTVAT